MSPHSTTLAPPNTQQPPCSDRITPTLLLSTFAGGDELIEAKASFLVKDTASAISDFKTYDTEGKTIARDKGIANTCEGSTFIQVFADTTRQASIVKIQDAAQVLTAGNGGILTTAAVMHFATDPDMTLSYGGEGMGVTFVNLVATVEPTARATAQLLGLDFVLVPVMDAAPTWDQPYASIESGEKIDEGYKWWPLVKNLHDSWWGPKKRFKELKPFFFSRTIFTSLPKTVTTGKKQIESGLSAWMPDSAKIFKLKSGGLVGSAVHPSVPKASAVSMQQVLAFAQFVLGDKHARAMPIFAMASNEELSKMIQIGIDNIDSAFMVQLRTENGRSIAKKALDSALGRDLGSIIFAALMSQTNLRAATKKAYDEAAKAAGYDDAKDLFEKALKGTAEEKADAQKVVIYDSRAPKGTIEHPSTYEHGRRTVGELLDKVRVSGDLADISDTIKDCA